MGRVNWKREYLLCTLPFIGWAIGWKLDKIEDERLTRFRDKSALYGKSTPPAKPSW